MPDAEYLPVREGYDRWSEIYDTDGNPLFVLEGVCSETEHLMEARHHGMAPEVDGRVLINDGQGEPGTIVEVEITEAHADDLVGRIVGVPAESLVSDFAEVAGGAEVAG